MDKPLEKILIRYERIPLEFTTVIFPDGSQPSSVITTTNIQKSKSKLNIGGLHHETIHESSTDIELKPVSTTTTLSRYLYHKRWIWSSECSRYSQCSNSMSQKLQLQLQLARTLSVLIRIRMKEGFKFAHSSAGIINMVLEVDMIEGSAHCPSTPTSHCVIQYVLFPPNKLQKPQKKTYRHNSVFDNEDERSSILSIEEQKKIEKRLNQGKHVVSFAGDSIDCCSKHSTEDEYQIITECWIEPQHGTVVVNEKQNYNYMAGLMYEQLAEALWQVDSDCISSIFTFQHMQHMCMDQNIFVSNPDIDINKKQSQNKTVIIDAGRIYKLPFTFNVVNLLPKCRHHSSMTFSLFTADHNDTELNSASDEKKLNYMLECSFYSRLRLHNNRSFDVNDSDVSLDLNQTVNDQDIGLCFIKHVNNSRLILTVGPSLIEEKYNITDNLSDDNLQPLSRSRANTWHYTKRGTGQSFLNTQSQENSTHYYRTMSLGSKPYYKDSEDLSWAQLRLEQNFSTTEIKHSNYRSDVDTDGQDYPTHMFIDVYDCRQEDVENVLMSDSSSFDHSLINDYSEEISSSTATNSDEDEEEKNIISNQEQINFEELPVDPMLLEKYLYKIRVIYDRSLVTTVFQALHLGLNVRYMDIQRAVDRCQHRLISFDITDYIKVVCDHFKKNADSCSICPADNATLKLHHEMIHSKFSSTLDRHMLKPVANHQDYYFYDFIDDLDCDQYTKNRRQKYLANILLGETYHKTDFDTQEYDEQDIFPLFIHLVCTLKTNTVTKSQSIRSLPTCILELLSQDNDNETSRNIDFNDLKVSLDVYCLMLPMNVYDDDDDDDEEMDRYTSMNSSEQLHFPINSKSTVLQSSKQADEHENSFAYLSSSLPPLHAQGLAAFLAEVEWCMRDEMAAGLLLYPTVTPNSLVKIIEHVTNSPQSPSNDHQQIPVHFVVPSPCPSKYNNVSPFLQKLVQLDIILDNDYGNEEYALEQSTKDTFYVVEKNLHPSPDSTVFENNSDDLECSPDSNGCLTDTDHSKPILPNFWIILKIQSDQQCQKENKSNNNNSVNTSIVNVYFHCRFTESHIQGKYPEIMEIIKQNVHQAATVVNQTILLCRLYETKTCDPILEPIIEDHDSEDCDENGKTRKFMDHFTLGQFKCPVVWSTRFALHPRLQRATSMGILGIQVLHTVLEGFSIRNRRNMFVYREKSGSVFYLRIYENSSQLQQQEEQKHSNIIMYPLQYDSDDEDTISRCSSATSTTITSTIFSCNQSNSSRKFSEDNYMDSKSIQTPGTRSLGGYWGDVDSRDVDDLILKVHGISPVGNDIQIDLMKVLQNRLDDGILELLTTMLYRNPQCRLYPDDVRFVQPMNGYPDYTMKLSLPIETNITKLFIHNLKRNAATLLLFPPQYASRHHRFNYAYNTINDTKKPIIRSFFMYNQPIAGTSVIGGKRITSGKRGLACVLFDIYSNEDHDTIDYLYDYPTDPDLFESRTLATCIDELTSTTEYSGYINLFVWWRGRDNMEVLQQKLTSTVTHSLWDIYIERFLWEQPLIIEQPSEIYVNPLCIQYLAKWIAFGAHKSVPLAHHSKILCRIHINHVLREFKTHLSWSWLSTSNKLPISIRYFYVPCTKYGETSADCLSNNLISGSNNPLQLGKKHDPSLNNLMFYEWQIPDTSSVVCPPSAACVLIVVSVTSNKNKQKRKRHQNLNMGNEHSDSDVDNSIVVPENPENINTEEDNITTLTTDDQLMSLNNETENVIKNEDVTQDTVSDCKKNQKEKEISTCDGKITKLFLLAVSGQSVHSLAYNCHKKEDQLIGIEHLSHWLKYRHIAFTSSIYHMIGLRNSKMYCSFENIKIKSHSSKTNNNLDLLLNYKNYVTVVGGHECYEKIFVEKKFRLNNRNSKPLEIDTEDKKNKPLKYKTDFQDSYIERLVRNSKQRRRSEMYQKLLYDIWIQVDAVVTKEAFRTFYQHSRLMHYCLTPLLFLPWWRLESAATRDHLVDASKLKNVAFTQTPQWHRRLCARLTIAYAQFIETDSVFSGFQPIQIGKSRINDGIIMDPDNTKSITRYYKKTIPGVSGGLLLIEIGLCQPFYYIKLSGIERARITNQVENYKDKPFALLEQSENLIQNIHLHSFTYDFHVQMLSNRLTKLVDKQKAGKRCNYGCDISMLLDHKTSILNSASKTGSSNKKNSIAGFLDDFLKYYNLPPLYSSCLVLAGVIKRTEISVTGLQLYEYLIENCSEDCEGMAVLKIGDSSSVDEEDGASLFDDIEDHEILDPQHIFGNDLTDYILVHHMAGSDIQRRQELANNSKRRKLGLESNEFFTDENQYEVCGLYDATLVMTLSSVKQLLLDTSNEITLSYYMLLTNNENKKLEKKKTVSLKTTYNMQQRHSTPTRPSNHRFYQTNNLLLSASVPSDSVGNSMTSGSASCGGSLDENNTFKSWSQLPPNQLPHLKKKHKKNSEFVHVDLNGHHQQTIKKTNLIKFYEKKAAELVAHTVDTAANRCRIHLLWKLFSKPIDQQNLGSTEVTFDQLRELVNTSIFVKSLSDYETNYRGILKVLDKQPQWFSLLHKIITEQELLFLETNSASTPQCRIYTNSNRLEHQCMVILPNLTEFDEFNAFLIIDNGIDSSQKLVSSSNSLINIVFRRNISGSDEVAALVETVGDAICYLIWQSIK